VEPDRESLQGGVNVVAHLDVLHRRASVNRFDAFDELAAPK